MTLHCEAGGVTQPLPETFMDTPWSFWLSHGHVPLGAQLRCACGDTLNIGPKYVQPGRTNDTLQAIFDWYEAHVSHQLGATV